MGELIIRSVKRMKEFDIKFHGIAKVKAYTIDSARAQVENSKNLKSYKPVRTESLSYWMGESLLMNFGGMIAGFITICLIIAFIQLLKVMMELVFPINLIGTVVTIILLVAVVRMPNLIEGWFPDRRYD